MKNMKNFLIILISSIALVFTSCEGPGYQPDGTQGPSQGGPQVSGQVVVSIGGGSPQQGVPTVPVMAPLLSGIVYMPVAENYWFTDYSLSYPNERYKTVVTINNQDYQVAVTQATLYAMRSYAINKGYAFVNVSIGTLSGYGYAVPEIIGYY